MTSSGTIRPSSPMRRRQFITLAGAFVGAVSLGSCAPASNALPAKGSVDVLGSTGNTARPSPDKPVSLPMLVGAEVRRPGESTITLPANWSVTRVYRSAVGVLVDATEADARFLGVVGKDGVPRRLDSIAPPIAVSADGQLVAGLVPIPQKPGDAAMPAREALIIRLASNRIEHQVRVGVLFPEIFIAPDTLLLANSGGGMEVWTLAQGLAPLPTPVGFRPVGRTARGDAIAVNESGSVAAFSWPAGIRQWSMQGTARSWPVVSPSGLRIAVLTEGRRLVFLRSQDGAIDGDVACPLSEGPRLVWESDEDVLISDSSPRDGAVLRGNRQGCTVAFDGSGLVAS